MLTAHLLLLATLSPLTPLQDDTPVVVQQPRAADQEARKKLPTKKELKKSLRATERKIRHAELDLKVAELKAKEDVAKAEFALQDKEHGVRAAELALHRQKAFDGPTAAREAELGVERSENRLHSAQMDLEGILRIYAEEEEAQAKDEIIRRHKMSVHFAQEEVKLSKRRLAKVVELDNEAKDDALEWGLHKAKSEVELAKRALDRSQLSSDVAMVKAQDALEAANEDREDLEVKLQEALLREEQQEMNGEKGDGR